jgi:hypothetical protein
MLPLLIPTQCDKILLYMPPSLFSLSPSEKVARMPGFTLSVTGDNFNQYSIIVFDGNRKSTTLVSDTKLTCSIASEDITMGAAETDKQIPVKVINSLNENSSSSILYFTVKSIHAFVEARKIADAPTYYYAEIHPVLCLHPSGNLYCAWNEKLNLFFCRSTDGGDTWTTPTLLTSNQQGDRYPNPALAADSQGTLFLVCNQSSDIYLYISKDQGQTWEPRRNLSGFTTGSSLPNIHIDQSDRIFVVFCAVGNYDYRVRILLSTDFGLTWTQLNPILNFDFFSGGRTQIVSDQGGYLYVTWPTAYGRYIFHKFCHSSDNGQNWSEIKNVLNSSRVALGVDTAGGVHVVGGDMYLPYMYRLQLASSVDRGLTWQYTLLSNSWDPADLAIDTVDNFHVAWKDQFIRSIDRGLSWTGPVVYTTVSSAVNPAMAADAVGNIYIVWWNQEGGIYFSQSQE